MSKTNIRIGEVLIEQGVLSEQQVFEITQEQKKQRLPFGVLAEQLFDVTVDSVEHAWIEQYHRFTGTINLNEFDPDPDALALISRRQAWQFEMLPLFFEPGGELVIAASRRRLARAVTFATQQIDHVVYFRVADDGPLRDAMQRVYPMPAVNPDLLQQTRLLAEAG